MSKTPGSGESTVREVFGDERLNKGRFIADYAFGQSPEAPNAERDAELVKYGGASRFFTSFTDEQPQATATVHRMTENVRGAVVAMGGIGGVASLPTGRRQGHVRNLFMRMFEEMRNDGHVVSTLYPFRESFYERLGYATFPATRFVTFDPTHLAPVVKLPKPGYVEQLPMSEAWETWRGFTERLQSTRHGFSLRDTSSDIRSKNENSSWVALAYDPAGEIIGGMTFRITGYGKRLEADSFYYETPAAKYLLLEWVGRHIDQVSEASIEIASDDYADMWVKDLGEKISTVNENAWPGPMGRVISVDGLNGIGAGTGEITLQIVDDYASWNSSVFTFAGDNGVLRVVPGGEPSATVTIQGLSSLVFTGQNPGDFYFRGWGDPDEVAQKTLRTLFPFVVPILHEEF